MIRFTQMNDRAGMATPRAPELALVGLVAAALRMAVILAVPAAGLFSDMADYHGRAEMMLHEGRLYPDAWRGPGYPLFLAVMYALPGPDLLTARIGQAVIGGVTAALTSVLASVFVGRRAALAAGLLVAAYPALVLSSLYIMPEGLYSFFLVATLVTARQLDARRGLAAGVLTGCATLTRSLGIALVPALVVGRAVAGWRTGGWRKPLVASLVVCAACLLTLAPWLRHTSRVSGGIMLDSASAYNVLAGSNPRARERLQLEDVQWMVDTYLTGSTSEADRSRRALRHSWEWIRENPGAWLRLVPLKIAYLWGLEGREHAWVYSVSYLGPRRAATMWTWGVLLLVTFPLLAMLAAVGLFRPGLTSRATGVHIAVLLVIVSVLHAFSFSETRYHLPLVPLLAVLGVRGVAGDGRFTRGRYAACAVVILALVAGWISQAPELMTRLLRLVEPDGWHTNLPF